MLLYKKLIAYSRIYKFAGKKLQCVWYKSGRGGAPTPAYVQNHTPRGGTLSTGKCVFLLGGQGGVGMVVALASCQQKKGKGIIPVPCEKLLLLLELDALAVHPRPVNSSAVECVFTKLSDRQRLA